MVQSTFDFPDKDTEKIEVPFVKGDFTVDVLFSMSNTPLRIGAGNHEQCLTMARSIINMIIIEHKIHYPGFQFTTHVRPSVRCETCLTLMKTDMRKSWPTSGLHATFEIRSAS